MARPESVAPRHRGRRAACLVGWSLAGLASLAGCGPAVVAPPVPAWRLELEDLSARFAVDRTLEEASRWRLVTLLAFVANRPDQADRVAESLGDGPARAGVALRRLVRAPHQAEALRQRFQAGAPALGDTAAAAGLEATPPVETPPAENLAVEALAVEALAVEALAGWLTGASRPDSAALAGAWPQALAAAEGDPVRLAEAFWLAYVLDPAQAAPIAARWQARWPACPEADLAQALTAPDRETAAAALARAQAGGVALAAELLSALWHREGRPSAAQRAAFEAARLAGTAPRRVPRSLPDGWAPVPVEPSGATPTP